MGWIQFRRHGFLQHLVLPALLEDRSLATSLTISAFTHYGLYCANQVGWSG